MAIARNFESTLPRLSNPWVSAVREWDGFRVADVEEYRELDDERVLVLHSFTASGKGSGLRVEQTRPRSAMLFCLRGDKVTGLRLFSYDRDHVLRRPPYRTVPFGLTGGGSVRQIILVGRQQSCLLSPPHVAHNLCLSTRVPAAQSSGAELYWEKAGSGPRLLFCNGSGMTVDNARPLLEIVGRGLELLAWDYRGVGRSSRVTAPYTMADLAEDAIAVLDAARWESCCLMGLSFGGMVAQEFAVTHPQRVQRLALACTSAGGACGASYPLERLAELDEAERNARWRALMDERWDDSWLSEHPADLALAQQAVVDHDQLDPGGAQGRRLQMQARAGHDVCERLGAIDSPTLVGYGRYDGIAPQANSRTIASRIRGAELRGYDGGHLFIVQDSAALPDFAAFLAAQ